MGEAGDGARSADAERRSGEHGDTDLGDARKGDTVGSDPDSTDSVPGVPATPRNRAKSATLWGAVGGFSFLVLAQGHLLLGGDLPIRYAWLFALAGIVAAVAGGAAYLFEHRIAARLAKRRT